MTDRPILFSAPMVLAILREIRNPGTGKTQTRRVLKPQPTSYQGRLEEITQIGTVGYPTAIFAKKLSNGSFGEIVKFAPGDRLWVRESWRTLHKWDCIKPSHLADDPSKITFEADPEGRNPLWAFGKLRPSMFMPRWASRITLDVTDVKVQRLQEISREDCIAEGCKGFVSHDGEDGEMPEEEFRALWDNLNADRGFGWSDNPWIVAVTFRPHLRNIDQMEKAA